MATKTNEEIADEIYREINTWEHSDLVKYLVDSLSLEARKNWIYEYHEGQEGSKEWSKKALGIK